MPTNPYITGLDLTAQPPRSPKVKVGGFRILGRTIDKCRAALFGKIGEYHFDCPLDNSLFGWKGIRGADFKAYVAEGHSDEEIGEWVRAHGTARMPDEIAAWNDSVLKNNYADDPEGQEWLQGQNVKLGIPKNSTLFDMLEADDRASFKK